MESSRAKPNQMWKENKDLRHMGETEKWSMNRNITKGFETYRYIRQRI